MGKTARLYTYRNGQKVYLEKEVDEMIVRETPRELERRGITRGVEPVSPASTKVKVDPDKLDETMEEFRKDTVTHHSYTQKDNNAEFLVTDRIMVLFKPGTTLEQINAFLARYALLVVEKYSDLEFLFQLTNQTDMNPLKLVVIINETEMDIVEFCEHDLNKRMKKAAINFPTDSKYQQQWHLHKRLTHSHFDQRASSNCEEAWQLLDHFGNADIVVGVTDDGCKLDHKDFDSPGKFATWGYMEGSVLNHRDSVGAEPQLMYKSGANHGTSCCGVIGAEIDAALTVGAAPGCRLLPIKWESNGSSLGISDSKFRKVLEFVADKVDILSNSWGSTPESVWSLSVVNKIKDLAQNGGRRGKGIVFLFAAGNENCPINHSGNLDIPYDHGRDDDGNWIGVSTSKIFENNLVDIPGVQHIAAMASNAQRSHYSNYGNGISLCAPSSNSHEYWRLNVTGLDILTTSGKSTSIDSQFGGTSSATPLVAGVAALVLSANPNLTSLEVISILQRTASKNVNLDVYPKTPAASYDMNPVWDISPVAPFATGNFVTNGHADGSWSGWFGFGKVDAKAAVAEALRLLGGSSNAGTQVITQTASPNLAIPDNNTSGVSDVMVITDTGTISAVKVDLDLLHTFIGDLVIRLLSPRGTPAILQDRNGGSAKNINKTFDVQSTPTLARCVGEPMDGNWTLEVIDAAEADSGTLQSWTLHISTGNSVDINMEESPGVTIPDNKPAGIERKLIATDSGTIGDVKVEVDITHTYISDLIVNLVSPNNTTITLHSRSGGDADNIIKTYQATNLPALNNLQGQGIQGEWKLRISDVVGQDVGKLNRWKIIIRKQ